MVMFGGLHLEMGMWKTLGDFLAASGWTEVLTEAGLASSGVAESFLKVSHLTRTRHAHQITVAAFYKLQRQAFSLSGQSDFKGWRLKLMKESPTFQYWDMVMGLEKLILTFVRAHRERDFNLYVQSLELIVGCFFALDHYNYARWVPIHINDMKSLQGSFKEIFKEYWVVPKTSNRFSAIPLDQTHEQENAKVKGVGGVIGLTQNTATLNRWMICGPEISTLFDEFEGGFSNEEEQDIQLHHEEGLASQKTFKKQVQDLVDAVTEFLETHS